MIIENLKPQKKQDLNLHHCLHSNKRCNKTPSYPQYQLHVFIFSMTVLFDRVYYLSCELTSSLLSKTPYTSSQISEGPSYWGHCTVHSLSLDTTRYNQQVVFWVPWST